MIPQHPPKGDESKERTVRVSGDKKQIDMARELIKEVMNQVSSWPDDFLFKIITMLVIFSSKKICISNVFHYSDEIVHSFFQDLIFLYRFFEKNVTNHI